MSQKDEGTFSQCSNRWSRNGAMGQSRHFERSGPMSALPPIVLQKSKVVGLRIFRENTKREALADSYNLNRVTEVACEFIVRR
jgi:hypothetical protein